MASWDWEKRECCCELSRRADALYFPKIKKNKSEHCGAVLGVVIVGGFHFLRRVSP